MNRASEAHEKKQIIIFTQFNHPRALTPDAIQAIRELRNCGGIIRNQTVLLKGVNDDADVLTSLMNGFVVCSVLPKYFSIPSRYSRTVWISDDIKMI